MTTAWWGTKQRTSPRAQLEVAVMRGKFPEDRWVTINTRGGTGLRRTVRVGLSARMELIQAHEQDFLQWVVDLRFDDSDEDFSFTLTYPENYPSEPPVVSITSSTRGGCPHLLFGHQPCLYYPSEDGPVWDPSCDTAVVVTGWVIEWFMAMRTWRDSGYWPGDSA